MSISEWHFSFDPLFYLELKYHSYRNNYRITVMTSKGKMVRTCLHRTQSNRKRSNVVSTRYLHLSNCVQLELTSINKIEPEPFHDCSVYFLRLFFWCHGTIILIFEVSTRLVFIQTLQRILRQFWTQASRKFWVIQIEVPRYGHIFTWLYGIRRDNGRLSVILL